MSLNAGMMATGKTEWETPPALFAYWDGIFNFTLDVCATKENAKCERYFDIEHNALKQRWGPERCWLNPPYGNGIWEWVQYARNEARINKALVVCLLPARTDTKWWHNYVMDADLIKFLPGRVKFVGGKSAAPFPSAIAVFLPGAKI